MLALQGVIPFLGGIVEESFLVSGLCLVGSGSTVEALGVSGFCPEVRWGGRVQFSAKALSSTGSMPARMTPSGVVFLLGGVTEDLVHVHPGRGHGLALEECLV